MKKTNVIAVFDIGKTNKKLFLFDELYSIVLERTAKFAETTDDDGDPCEDLAALTKWVFDAMDEITTMPDINLVAVNFSTYGASFVHIDGDGHPVAPLYNYLKSYPEDLSANFYKKYHGEVTFSMQTASPILGHLNSGLQLYWLKERKKTMFSKVRFSLHLPQYMSYLITKRAYSDITSIGCHTGLWNFPQNQYHEWLYREDIISRLAPVFPSDQVMQTNWKMRPLLCGVGLHDSSAALIPYIAGFNFPFVLISTGTWCISLNPFNQTRLTSEELKSDCLCYLEYRGKPIKASRLFAGYFHEQQIKRLARHFKVSEDYFTSVQYNPALIRKEGDLPEGLSDRDLSAFETYESAYHNIIYDIVRSQIRSTDLVLNNAPVTCIFVDGGFSRNPIYMNLLAEHYSNLEVYAASVAQATAVGAALAVHTHWNRLPVPENLISLTQYGKVPASLG